MLPRTYEHQVCSIARSLELIGDRWTLLIIRDLWPVLMSLLFWGDRYLAAEGPPLIPLHRSCGGRLTPQLACADCGAGLGPGKWN
jgi:DNA-binding HxlR family transcriptional regulator